MSLTETAKRIPAEGFTLGSYIQEELDARGWSVSELALRMVAEDIAIWQLTIELQIAMDEPTLLSQETADRLGAAFDVSPESFINLNNAYSEWFAHKATKKEPA